MSERWPAKPGDGVTCMASGCKAAAVETCLLAGPYAKRQDEIRKLKEEGWGLEALALKPLAWTPSSFLCEEHVLEFESRGDVVRNPKRKRLSLRVVTRELEQIRAALAS